MRDYAGLERIVYKMFDYGDEDLASTHPEWGDIGSHNFFTWDQLHVGYNQFNFSRIENWLMKLAGKKRPSGAPQSGVMLIVNHISSYPKWPGWRDCTPTFVYDQWDSANPPTERRPIMCGRKVGHIAYSKGVQHSIPMSLDTTFWWTAQRQFVEALGRWYGSLVPELRGILKTLFFAPGLDGEPHDTKDGVPSPNGARFPQLCEKTIEWHDNAFPDLPLFFSCTTSQNRLKYAQLSHARGIGIKHCGLIDDMNSSKGYSWKNPAGDALEDLLHVGAWDQMQWAMEHGQPMWVESAHNISAPQRELAHHRALHFKPLVGIDLHSEWLRDIKPEQLDFIRAHMHRTAAEAPGAWCRLRDMEYPLVTWTQSTTDVKVGESGHPGNFDYYLHMVDGANAPAARGVGPEDAEESGQCRLVVDATFEIDPAFAAEATAFALNIRWLDQDSRTLTVDDGQSAQVIQGTGAQIWKTVPLVVRGRRFSLRSSGAAVHSLYVTPLEVEEPEPKPPEPDYAVMLGTVDETQAMIDEAKMSLVDASTALQELRKMIEAQA